MRLWRALALAFVACSSSSSHPPPLGDCPVGDRCNTTTGGGEHVLPEGGAEAGTDGGLFDEAGIFDADVDTAIPPIDASFE